MKLKEQYQINDVTWKKLKSTYIKVILLGSFYIAGVFSFITWPIIDNFSWALVPIIPWFICFVFFLYSFKSYFKYSRRTLLIVFINIMLLVYYFGMMGCACTYRLFGSYGLITHIFIFIIGFPILLVQNYHKVNTLWHRHDTFNELKVLDLDEGRYDYITGFDLHDKGQSVAATSFLYFIIPIAVGTGLILSKKGYIATIMVIGMILGSFTTFGFVKVLAAAFYNYRKIVLFEKQINKPIINGLLN